MATETTRTGDDAGVGIGWRAFQTVALVTALSYVIGWISIDPTRYLVGRETGAEMILGLIGFLSPLISIVLIGLALTPNRLSWLTDADTWTSRILLGLLLGLTLSWMFGALIGPMYTAFLTQPLSPSGLIPFTGGVFLYMVFQHWFQGIATIVLALNPDWFGNLTDQPTPAGIQCAVVDCE